MGSQVKQVLVWRSDLKVRRGKEDAQMAHAAVGSLLKIIRNDSKSEIKYHIAPGSAMDEWLNGRFAKISVSVNSEAELIDIYKQAEKAGLPCVLITDAGLTEFKGVPTKTCVGIGPAWGGEIDKITGKLPLR